MKVDFLKKRAEQFLKNAGNLFKKGVYALAAFNFEQALQLYLKYYLFLKLKDFPRTHSIRILLIEIGKVYTKELEIRKLIEENISLIADLEQVYITSRYLPAEFNKNQIEKMKNFVKDTIKFLEKL